jgi:hypothetical protein
MLKNKTKKIISILLAATIIMNLIAPVFSAPPLDEDEWKTIVLKDKASKDVISQAKHKKQVDKVNFAYNPRRVFTELTFWIEHDQNFAIKLYYLKEGVDPEKVSTFTYSQAPVGAPVLPYEEKDFIGYLYGSKDVDGKNPISFDNHLFKGYNGPPTPPGQPHNDWEDYNIKNTLYWNGYVSDGKGGSIFPFDDNDEGKYRLVIVLQPLTAGPDT